MTKSPLKKVNFIGCGRLGRSLAKLMINSGFYSIEGVVTTHFASAAAAVKLIGQGTAYQSIAELPAADIYFIAINDDEILTAAQYLTENKHLNRQALIIHCSGSRNSDLLNSLQNLGCRTACLHPIKSFADSTEDCIKNFAGTFCTIEADSQASLEAAQVVENIGGNAIFIKKEQKMHYHAACVMASNYLITLHYHVMQAYEKAGIDPILAKQITSQLMLAGLTRLNDLSHEKALTGPIQRGDLATIAGNIDAISDNSVSKSIYTSLGLGTLPLTSHTEEIRDKLITILKD